MASFSEPRPAYWTRLVRHWWTLALALCPVSYVALVLILYEPVVGWFAALLLLASVYRVTPRNRLVRLHSRRAWALALLAGIAVGVVARMVARVTEGAALLCGLAVVVEIGFTWAATSSLRRDLGGAHFDAGATVRGEVRPDRAPARPTLAYVLFFSLLVLAAGAMWSRGELWAPRPTGWVLALLLLTVGTMLAERLSFLEHSARHGNLALPAHSYRRWLAAAAVMLVVATALAAAGPWKTPQPQDTARTGSRTEIRPSPPPLPQLQQQLQRLSMSAASAAAAAASTPHQTLALWLLLLLLLLLLIVIWLFSRSRAARWLLSLFAWLVARAVKAWRWLRARLHWRRPNPAEAQSKRGPTPPWARDPFYDIFAHPEVVALLSRRDIVLRTYHLFLTLAEVLGQDRRANQTPLEYAHSLQLATPEAASALGDLTWGYVHAMYGGASAELPEPTEVQAAWGRVSESLTGHLQAEDLALRKQAYLQRASRRPSPSLSR